MIAKKIFSTISIFIVLILSACDNGTVPNESEYIIDKDPCWSPDGSKIAYITGEFDEFGIYSINVDGTNKKKMSNFGIPGLPDWSPDGEWIVYTSAGTIFKKRIEGDTATIQL